jgi:hypothetical protein
MGIMILGALGTGKTSTCRLHQLEAVECWYLHGWSKLDTRLRSSITDGVAIFLSLFDHNPAVQAAFRPPRSAYARMLKPGDPTAAAADRGAARNRARAAPEYSPWRRTPDWRGRSVCC